MELLVNNVETTLAAGIDSSQTTFVVASTTGLPTTGNFRIRIDDEIMLVTARSGSTLTVVRGSEGTTPDDHDDGSRVPIVLTAGALAARQSDFVIRATYASKPSAGVKGRLFLPTDGIFLEYDDGSAWHKYGPFHPFKTPPDFRNSPWAWVNQSNTFLMDGPILNRPATGTNQISALVKSLSAPFTITACLAAANQDAGVLYSYGLILYDSTGSDDSITWGFAAGDLQTTYFSASTGQAGSTGNFEEPYPPHQLVWLQIEDDTTNRHYRMSVDGINFVTYLTEANTTHVATDKVGIFVANAATGRILNVAVLSWDG